MTTDKTIRIAMIGAGLSIRGGITSVENLILENAPDSVSIIHLPTFNHGTILHNAKVYWTAIFNLYGLLLSDAIDVVHIHFSDRGSGVRKMLPCILALILSCPIVLHSHCAFHKEFYASIPGFAQWIITGVLRRCVVFISLSKSWDAYFTECFRLAPGQHVVLYNPVKIQPVPPIRNENSMVTFVFLGVIGSRIGNNNSGSMQMANKVITLPGQDKGSFDCIKAFALLDGEARQKARMVIAGDGDIAGATRLISELGLETFITIRQWLNIKQRDELLSASDAFLLPSFHEGLPMSMLEAMAFELPVIVSAVGGIPEIITHGKEGLFVRPGNHSEIANAMETMIADASERRAMGKRARDRVEPLRIENYMESLNAIYRQAIG
jgi:glycosyltransferase involved in cell wall biosynthesis